MATKRTDRHARDAGEGDSEQPTTSAPERRTRGRSHTAGNGASASAATADEQTTADAPAVQRAEEMVDRMAERVGQFASAVGRQVLRLGARAREEAEDMWAEAQNIRHGAQSQGPPNP